METHINRNRSKLQNCSVCYHYYLKKDFLPLFIPKGRLSILAPNDIFVFGILGLCIVSNEGL